MTQGIKIDEIKIYYLEKINVINNLEELEEVINICQQLNLKEVLLHAYSKKAEILYENGEYTKAFIIYNNVLEPSYNFNKEILPSIYNKMGKCMLGNLKYEEALPYFEKAYGLAVRDKDNNVEKYALFNIAFSYKKLNFIDECLSILESYISLIDVNCEFNEYIDGIILQANCYIAKREFYKALQIYEAALELFEDEEDTRLGYIYNNLGVVNFETNRVDEAIYYFEKAQSIRRGRDLLNLSHTLIDKAAVHFIIGDNEKALELANEGISMASEFHDREYELKGYYLLENFYKNSCSFEELKEVYKKIINILGDKQQITKIYAKLALLHIENHEIEASKEYLSRIVEL